MGCLFKQVADMERKLADPTFAASASQEVIEHVEAELARARTERDAIRGFLDKLG